MLHNLFCSHKERIDDVCPNDAHSWDIIGPRSITGDVLGCLGGLSCHLRNLSLLFLWHLVGFCRCISVWLGIDWDLMALSLSWRHEIIRLLLVCQNCSLGDFNKTRAVHFIKIQRRNLWHRFASLPLSQWLYRAITEVGKFRDHGNFCLICRIQVTKCLLGQSDRCILLIVLDFFKSKLGLLVERVDNLTEKLVFSDSILTLRLEIGLGVSEEEVKLLILCLIYALWGLLKAAKDIEL